MERIACFLPQPSRAGLTREPQSVGMTGHGLGRERAQG